MGIEFNEKDEVKMICAPYLAGTISYIYEGIYEREARIDTKYEGMVIVGTRNLRHTKKGREEMDQEDELVYDEIFR